jgi:hypothetical protein
MEEIANATIAKAVDLLRNSPNATDADAFKSLMALGLPRQHAARLVELLPIAYVRVMLQNSGVSFSDSFHRECSDSKVRLLSDEPLWSAVCTFAADEIKRGITSQELFLLAARSAEFEAINRLLKSGGTLENLVLTSPVLLWSQNGPEFTESRTV